MDNSLIKKITTTENNIEKTNDRADKGVKRRREKGRVITNHMLSSVIFLIASFACSLLLRPFQACDSKMKIAKPRKEKGEEGKRQIQCVVVRLTCVLPCPCRLLALSASKITIDRTVSSQW